MQQLDPQLEIASRVLSGIIAQDRNRKLSDRMEDILHSLEVAAELIRQRDGHTTPALEHKPRLGAPPKALERRIQRDEMPPLPDLIAAQRNEQIERPRRRPTLH